MRFRYTEYEVAKGKIITRPTLPITFKSGDVTIPVADALVDTGADQTLLPLSFAIPFGFTFDLKKDGEEWSSAGGGKFKVYSAPQPIKFVLEQQGYRPIQWTGLVAFALNQPMILLGHNGCLEYLDIRFYGKQKILDVEKA